MRPRGTPGSSPLPDGPMGRCPYPPLFFGLSGNRALRAYNSLEKALASAPHAPHSPARDTHPAPPGSNTRWAVDPLLHLQPRSPLLFSDLLCCVHAAGWGAFWRACGALRLGRRGADGVCRHAHCARRVRGARGQGSGECRLGCWTRKRQRRGAGGAVAFLGDLQLLLPLASSLAQLASDAHRDANWAACRLPLLPC